MWGEFFKVLGAENSVNECGMYYLNFKRCSPADLSQGEYMEGNPALFILIVIAIQIAATWVIMICGIVMKRLFGACKRRAALRRANDEFRVRSAAERFRRAQQGRYGCT